MRISFASGGSSFILPRQIGNSAFNSVERQLRNIVEAISEGVPARTLKEELLRLEAQQGELHELLAGRSPTVPSSIPGLAEVYRRKVAALHEALENETTRDKTIEVIRALVEAVVLVTISCRWRSANGRRGAPCRIPPERQAAEATFQVFNQPFPR
jgi:hypothetical protein